MARSSGVVAHEATLQRFWLLVPILVLAITWYNIQQFQFERFCHITARLFQQLIWIKLMLTEFRRKLWQLHRRHLCLIGARFELVFSYNRTNESSADTSWPHQLANLTFFVVTLTVLITCSTTTVFVVTPIVFDIMCDIVLDNHRSYNFNAEPTIVNFVSLRWHYFFGSEPSPFRFNDTSSHQFPNEQFFVASSR